MEPFVEEEETVVAPVVGPDVLDFDCPEGLLLCPRRSCSCSASAACFFSLAPFMGDEDSDFPPDPSSPFTTALALEASDFDLFLGVDDEDRRRLEEEEVKVSLNRCSVNARSTPAALYSSEFSRLNSWQLSNIRHMSARKVLGESSYEAILLLIVDKSIGFFTISV